MVENEVEQVASRKITLKALALPDIITVGDLAQKLGVEPVQVIKALMRTGIFANVNQAVDFEVASQVSRPFGYAARRAAEVANNNAEALIRDEDESLLSPRPPVVTILGHVDHGKTTLLDAIRKTNVVSKEAGSITQHIGAYQVDYQGHPITFLDTPGHEAFTAMRARGAQVTDIAVLVVAADDGVMPQTAEAIDHIKAAEVPIVVAINKMDVPDADPERVRRQLSERELVVEKWGGEVIDVEVSAKSESGLQDLLESLLVVSEVAELRANPSRAASGVVVEARIDKTRGPLATVLIQTGTLNLSDYVVMGTRRGKVKALINDRGRRVKTAGPSMPIEVLGMGDLPEAGDQLNVVPDEKTARTLVTDRLRVMDLRISRGLTLKESGTSVSSGQTKALHLILKTDVQGSIDAIRQALGGLNTAETQVRIIHSATGTVTESDVLLAVASSAVIVGFNVRPEPGARRLADQDRIEIRYYDIIYRLLEDIESALSGMLEPSIEDVDEGKVEVRAVFPLAKNRTSAGCYVLEGRVSRGDLARVTRKGQLMFDGPIDSLRRFKDDVRQVTAGYECGLTIDGFGGFEVEDLIEVYRQRKSGSN